MRSQPGLGERLADLRRRAGLSQKQLAGDDLTASYLSLIESGKREPHRRVIDALAARLGCAADYLATGLDERARGAVTLELRYAELARRSGDPEGAEVRFAALASDPAVAAAGSRPDALLGHALALEDLGRLTDAAAAFEELRRLADDDPTAPTWWPAVLGLCRCHREIGDLGFAIEVGEAARHRLGRAGLLGTDMGVQVIATLVMAYFERGDLGRARVLIDEAIGRAEECATRVARGSAYWNASIVAQQEGRLGEAVTLAERALALYADGDDDWSRAALREIRGWLLLRLDPPQPHVALADLEAAAGQLTDLGSGDLASCETEIARAHLLLDDPGRASEFGTRALSRLHGGKPIEAARARAVVAAAQYTLGNRQAAEQAYERAAVDLAHATASREAAAAWLELAELAERNGRATVALDAYRRATTVAGLRAAGTKPLTVRKPLSAVDAPAQPAPDVALR